MNRWQFAAALLPLALAGPRALAQEAYVSLDSFSSGPIDAERWSPLDRARTVSESALKLMMREPGGTASDTGTTSVNWSQSLNVPQPVTQLKALVRVNGYELGSCAANPASSRVRARLLGSFFNTGSPTLGSSVGDMFPQIYLYRQSDSGDPQGMLRVEAWLGVCTDSECTVGKTVGTAALGTASVGQNVSLQLEWDKPNKKFVFARDSNAHRVELGYTQNDHIEPARGFKSLGVRTDIENCASGPRVMGSIDARFDNVAVNTQAKP